MYPSSASILIVGAGPVGLSLAIELARQGVRPRIVDAAAGQSPFCRAIGVSPRTLELFEAMGVARDICAAGLRITGRRLIAHRGADTMVRNEAIDLSDLPYTHYAVPQDRTEAVLEGHLKRVGILVERGNRLVGLNQGTDGIVVELERRGRVERVSCDYVVGCDGAHSAVRKALGIAFEGDAFPYEFMLGDVSIDWDLPRGMTLQAIRPSNDGPPDFFVAIPLTERHRYRISMMASSRPASASDADVAHGIQSERPGATLAQLQEVVDRLLPERPRLSDMRWSSMFRISMRLAEHYRVGNVFLAGDACHIHPPTGGQGMNTGIQDACNLAWKLAAVARGLAEPALLDSYEAERRPVAASVIEDTVRRSINFGKPVEPPGRLHDTQLLVSYAAGPLARGDTGFTLQPGDRLPDVEGLRQQGTGFSVRLFDVMSAPGFTWLTWPADDGRERLEQTAGRLAAAWPGLVRTIAILPAGSSWDDPPGVTVVEDASGSVAALFGDMAPTSVLVRPDGYIASTGPLTEEHVLGYLLSVARLKQP